MKARTTEEVFKHHLKAYNEKNIKAIASDYKKDAIYINSTGVSITGVSKIMKIYQDFFNSQEEGATSVIKNQIIKGDIVYLEWSTDTPTYSIDDGVDTLVIKDGLICAQTVKFTMTPKPQVKKNKENISKKVKTGRPVKNLPIAFKWKTNQWFDIFEKQIELLKNDIKRAIAADKFIIYLSCPISSRGGSYSYTNVEIAYHTERRLMNKWGEKIWVLNPTRYQLESKEGTGLIRRHAEALGISNTVLEKLLKKENHAGGGDYMRMWTKVLAEDNENSSLKNTGQNFSGYYFLSPSDVHDYFSKGGSVDVVSGVEEYFASKYATNIDFKNSFDVATDWEKIRKEFIKFYSLKAGSNFSKGAHDEWNIWVLLNQARIKNGASISNLIPGFFEGKQIDPVSSANLIPTGYGILKED